MGSVRVEMQRDLGATNIPIDVLRSFVTVFDIGSTARAADCLRLTHAGLNAQIKKLRSYVDDSLFVRVDSALKLTDKGEALLAYARSILEMNDKIISLTGRNPDRRRIGIPKVYAGAFLESANIACSRPLQGLLPAFSCATSDQLAKSLFQGFLDIAILTERSDLTTATEFVWAEPIVWVRAPDLVLKPGSLLPLISSRTGPADQFAAEALFDARFGHEVVFTATDWNARIAAAMAGLGYLVAPRRIVPAGLEIARESYLPELRDLQCAIHVSARVDPKKIRVLLMRLAEVFIPRDQNSGLDFDTMMLAATAS